MLDSDISIISKLVSIYSLYSDSQTVGLYQPLNWHIHVAVLSPFYQAGVLCSVYISPARFLAEISKHLPEAGDKTTDNHQAYTYMAVCVIKRGEKLYIQLNTVKYM